MADTPLRMFGLLAGAMQTTDDFDAPLEEIDMAKVIEPKAFIVASTCVDRSESTEALKHIGVQDGYPDTDNDAQYLIEGAGRLCYLSYSMDSGLNKNMTRDSPFNNEQYIRRQLIGNKHLSVLEHATVSILFTNVSRVFTHELIRHRPGMAYSQTSGRYVREEEIRYYLPECLRTPDAFSIVQEAFENAEISVHKLEAITNIDAQPFSIKKALTSAFRRIIGFGHASHILVTANHRMWRYIIEQRSSPAAEEEQRVVMHQIAPKLKAEFPALYADMVEYRVDGSEIPSYRFKE